MRADVAGCRYTDQDVKTTIRHVYESRGYLLDPHSTIGYMGIRDYLSRQGAERQANHAGRAGQGGTERDRIGMFLATAHPAKFREVVEPVLGRPIDTPGPLADALARPRHVLKIGASFDAVRRTLTA